MRDKRFIAAHRGGPLSREDHVLLVRWAADCAERVLHLFTQSSDDVRPPAALKLARKWADGEVKTGAAMRASVAAHAAARGVGGKAAVAAARAAGHAVATAHFADHCMGALLYAMKALETSGVSVDSEFRLQISKLPPRLREPVSEGVLLRFRKLGIRRPGPPRG